MHKKHQWFIALLLSGLSQVAFSDEAADRTAIEAAAQAWAHAYNTHASETMAKLATDDVVLLDPVLAPVSGHRAAHDAWRQTLNRNQDTIETATKEIEIAGDFAWRIATMTRQANAVAKPTQTLEIWRRVDGKWKLHRQMSAGIIAPATLLRSPPGGPMRDSPTH